MSNATQSISKPHTIVQWGLVAILTAVIAIAALPSYFSGQWPWSNELPIPHLEEVRALSKAPLAIPGWESTFHQEVRIGGDRWILAEYSRASGNDQPEDSFALLLRPQWSADQQPEVEWVDLRGAQSWQVDARHSVRWQPPSTEHQGTSRKVTTQYLRAIDQRNTLAVMQWYAWPSGGHFAPGKWFWADQARQWQHRERMPWVAVSILLPIEPVGDIRTHTDAMTAIAQAVQQGLMSSTFAPTD